MKIVCAPHGFNFVPFKADLEVDLYAINKGRSSVGQAVYWAFHSKKLTPEPRAWDFLSIALSVIASDLTVSRSKSPDGWTREFELTIAVSDPDFWNGQRALLEKMVKFLSTDVWSIAFVGGGFLPAPPKKAVFPTEDSVSLISGGLDSFIGALDLAKSGKKPYLVSQTVTGDGEKQRHFAQIIGGGLSHIQLNHNASVPKQDSSPPSQRTRSLMFLAYAITTATTLKKHKDGEVVDLYMSENGLISVNPPLTGSRLGSLSTRTTHPIFIKLFQSLIDNASLNISIVNNYKFKTKGEMLKEAVDQDFLQANAHKTTSCGRFGVHGKKHCGRCVPCIIRRAAFLKWGMDDATEYVYSDLSIQDRSHGLYDDVRSAAMAALNVEQDGIRNLVGASLNSSILGDISQYLNVAERGMKEVKAFLSNQMVL